MISVSYDCLLIKTYYDALVATETYPRTTLVPEKNHDCNQWRIPDRAWKHAPRGITLMFNSLNVALNSFDVFGFGNWCLWRWWIMNRQGSAWNVTCSSAQSLVTGEASGHCGAAELTMPKYETVGLQAGLFDNQVGVFNTSTKRHVSLVFSDIIYLRC
jgi:hypothetical protein